MAHNVQTVTIVINGQGNLDRLKDVVHAAVVDAVARHFATAKIDIDVTVRQEDRMLQTTLRRRIAGLKGRSRLIAQYLYDNPGEHSTDDLNSLIMSEQPFRNSSILHSYLNNLISRGFIVKTDTGVYKSTRKA
jgi:hypothetical protein